MRITFPVAADKEFPPLLAFKNYVDESHNEETEYEYAFQLVDEINVHPDTNVMYADVDEDIIDMMNQCDVLYLMFQSLPTDNGDPEEIEITRMDLSQLHQAILKIIPEP